MTKNPKDERDSYPDYHDRFARRATTARHYRAEPPRDPASVNYPEPTEFRGDSTGIRLILEQVGVLNARTFEIHGQVSSLHTAQKDIRGDLRDVRAEQRVQGTKIDRLTRRVDRHSGKILSRAVKKKTLAPVDYLVKNFGTIFKIIVLVIIGVLFLLGITFSITDLSGLTKL